MHALRRSHPSHTPGPPRPLALKKLPDIGRAKFQISALATPPTTRMPRRPPSFADLFLRNMRLLGYPGEIVASLHAGPRSAAPARRGPPRDVHGWPRTHAVPVDAVARPGSRPARGGARGRDALRRARHRRVSGPARTPSVARPAPPAAAPSSAEASASPAPLPSAPSPAPRLDAGLFCRDAPPSARAVHAAVLFAARRGAGPGQARVRRMLAVPGRSTTRDFKRGAQRLLKQLEAEALSRGSVFGRRSRRAAASGSSCCSGSRRSRSSASPSTAGATLPLRPAPRRRSSARPRVPRRGEGVPPRRGSRRVSRRRFWRSVAGSGGTRPTRRVSRTSGRRARSG